MKERVTLTVEERLLKQVDLMVDGSLIKNRSHAFETLLAKGLGQHRLRKAIILAGGPKATERALQEVGDKSVLEHNLDLLAKHDITQVIISMSHNDTAIKELLGDGKDLGISITYIEEPIPLGTAGSLKFSKQLLKEPFVMVNCDELKDINIVDMFATHRQSNALATIAVTTSATHKGYGKVSLDGTRITEFVEKPDGLSRASLISSGLYIIEPDIFDFIPEGFCMIEHQIFPRLASRERLHGYLFSGQWFDCSNEKILERAKKEWKGIS